MKIKLCLDKFKYHDIPCKPLFYLYTMGGYNYYFYGYNWENILHNIGVYSLKKYLNQSSPLEKQLGRINGFYEVINNVEDDRLMILYDSVYYDSKERIEEAKRIDRESKGKVEKILLEWYGNGLEQNAYGISYEVFKDKIYYSYRDIDMEEGEGIEGELTREEFNLLMQIYYGLYDDEQLKKELEEKEKSGEYEEIKLYLKDEKRMYTIFEKKKEDIQEEEKKKLEEYLKLELMRKDTSGAFSELNIKKLYDANWDEEEQKKVVEKINKELLKEVVILDG